jgi:hypothetical protein
VTSLGTDGCLLVDHGEPDTTVTGDDRGGIAVSFTDVYYTGERSTARWDASDLGFGQAQSAGGPHEAIFSDLRTGVVYVFLDQNKGYSEPSGPGHLTHFQQLNVRGEPIGPRIPLVASHGARVVIPTLNGAGIFAGYGRVLLFSGTQWFHVRLPDGVVTPLQNENRRPVWHWCESWAIWGVGESWDGEYSVLFVRDSNTIVRYRLTDGVITHQWDFPDQAGELGLSDMCAFTFSPVRNRWYFHHEYTSALSYAAGLPEVNSLEVIGFCAGSFDAVE